ncbi:hypothetical protein JHK86_056331 [Glycine max]|nr:hypothetical protein JHK86_056331 [Glycine max]
MAISFHFMKAPLQRAMTRLGGLGSNSSAISQCGLIMDIGWRRGTEGRQQSGPFVEATNMMV